MSELSDDITSAASEPKQTTVDGQSVTKHSLPELIQADEHLSNATAGNRSALPIRLMKIKPPGAV